MDNILKYPDDFYNKIICGNNLDVIKGIPDESIDLIVTSPPYNVKARKLNPKISNTWSGKWNNSKLQISGYDSHNDYMDGAAYEEWQKSILNECVRVLRPDGAMFYNHRWRIQGGLLQYKMNYMSGFPVRQIIIWHKAGGINFNKGYFLPTYEVLYLIAKPKFRLPPKVNGYGDVWNIMQEKHSWHPAPFPIELASRCIEASSGDIILDPFSGSGTTALAAKLAGKTFIGIEISRDYCNQSINRINSGDVK